MRHKHQGQKTYCGLGLAGRAIQPLNCYNVLMEPEIIEAEIVETFDTQNAKKETLGGPVLRANEPPAWHTPGDHARSYGDRGGMLGGFLVLAMGFLVTALVLLVSVLIILPFTLLLRLLGIRKNK